MKIPEFSCFVETLTEEKISQIVSCATEKPMNLSLSLDSDKMSASFSKFMEELFARDIKITIAFLQEYHSWLAKQLDEE